MKRSGVTARVKNFHLPLPEYIYQALQEEAAVAGRPATVVAREAIEAWLHQRQKTVLREAIAAYAGDRAGTMVDLDPALEEAGLEAFRTRRR